MSRRILATIEVLDAGWVVTLNERYRSQDIICGTWQEVEAALLKHAFPYPNKKERREP